MGIDARAAGVLGGGAEGGDGVEEDIQEEKHN